MDNKLVTHRGGCHCGAVQIEVDSVAVLELDHCNCSICTMSGILHLCVPKERFRITQGADHLQNYKFGTGVATHPFCRTCGIKSFYYPRAYPEGVSVNANCLAKETIEDMNVTRHFNGVDWEEMMKSGGYVPPESSDPT